jgi:hypothetical protein
MGESLVWSADTRLRAAAPQHCRFTIVKDGEVVHQEQGRFLEWTPPSPGVYRLEADLNLCGQWRPWIYANPIWLKHLKDPDSPGPWPHESRASPHIPTAESRQRLLRQSAAALRLLGHTRKNMVRFSRYA